jgi:secreted trypsin-like serine protease
MAAPAAQAADTGKLIVGGSFASAGEYPYAVHLDGTLYSCGGTLIAPEWVLTAGHCIALVAPTVGAAIPAAHITATVGRTDLRNTSQGQQSIGVAAFMHPLYVGGIVPRFDVALIRLAKPITGYQTMKIAGPGEEATWKAGTQSTVIGWGATKSGGDGSDVLKEAQVPIVSDADCEKAYQLAGVGGVGVSEYSSINMLCAGYLGRGGTDTCQGDSGGPLLVPTTQGFRQAGITSWGYGCADPEYPGNYARIGTSLLRDFVALHVPSAIGSGAQPSGGSTTTTSKPSGGGTKPKSAATRRAVRRKYARQLKRDRAAARRAAQRR